MCTCGLSQSGRDNGVAVDLDNAHQVATAIVGKGPRPPAGSVTGTFATATVDFTRGLREVGRIARPDQHAPDSATGGNGLPPP